MQTVKDIRNKIVEKYKNEDFVIDKTGVKTVELVGESFVADEPHIVRETNWDYVERELEWYRSQSLNVYDIPGGTPKIWEQVSSKDGYINSNYGWCIWSEDNGNQYKNVLQELTNNKDSRRATMIYNRPSMHKDYNRDGMSDFMCTFANTFLIRDNKLVSHYLMRSNDCVHGFCNDYAWAREVQRELYKDLKDIYPNLKEGNIFWTATSLHVYEYHFKYIEKYI